MAGFYIFTNNKPRLTVRDAAEQRCIASALLPSIAIAQPRTKHVTFVSISWSIFRIRKGATYIHLHYARKICIAMHCNTNVDIFFT